MWLKHLLSAIFIYLNASEKRAMEVYIYK